MKLTKSDLRHQAELYKLLEKEKLNDDEIERFYLEFNPAYIDNLSQGVYFTPDGLANDIAVFAHKKGHVLDLCAGIGSLSYNLRLHDSWSRKIESITAIELNPKFCEIGKKLLPSVNWINGSVFDSGLIEGILKEKNIERFDCIVSNPPFGKIKQDVGAKLNYTGSFRPHGSGTCLAFR